MYHPKETTYTYTKSVLLSPSTLTINSVLGVIASRMDMHNTPTTFFHDDEGIRRNELPRVLGMWPDVWATRECAEGVNVSTMLVTDGWCSFVKIQGPGSRCVEPSFLLRGCVRVVSFTRIVLPRSGNLVPGRHMRWHHPLQRLGLGWFIFPVRCSQFTILM